MSEALDNAAHSFENEIKPAPEPSAPAPRDIRGRFVENTKTPEPMFQPREVEGDPLTGDTRDGGDNENLRAREREIADGRTERSSSNGSQRSVRTTREGEHDGTEVEQEDIWSILSENEDNDGADRRAPSEGDGRDAERSSERDAEGEKFEVTVDGETLHVTLQEALRGYTREATFHKRLAQLNQASQELSANDNVLRQNWAVWDKARRDYEEDVATMLPQEPNWDQEFAANPQNAHYQQKIFQTIYGKLASSQQARAWREAQAQQETDRRTQKYAVDGFSRFVMDNKIPDESTLNKNLISMRRTASDAGFNDYEIATVYDPRMLTVLLWASKFKRMMAARPRAVIPGKGRTLPPGASTPFSGNATRKGLDEALRRQASSGRLDDTAEVFRRLL